MKTEDECFLNKYAVCPHCGYAHPDAYEWFVYGNAETTDVECCSCGAEISVTQVVTIEYTTAPAKGWGTDNASKGGE